MPRKAAPPRQHLFRVVILAVGPVVGLVVGLIALNAPGRNVGLPPIFYVVIVGVVVVMGAVAIGIGLFVGTKLVGDRIEIAFRAPGETKWRHGRLEVHHGAVALRRYWWQLRVPVGEPIELAVRELGPDTGRRPAARQWWSLNPQMSIRDLETDRGTFEIAGLPAHLEELGERLREPDPV